MIRKVPISPTPNYQALAKQVVSLLRTCKAGEGVEISLQDVPRKEILQAALSREGRREGIKIRTMSSDAGLIAFFQDADTKRTHPAPPEQMPGGSEYERLKARLAQLQQMQK